MTAEARVRLAEPADIPRLRRVLANAFDDDPLIDRIVRGGERRAERMERFYDVLLRRLSDRLSATFTNTEMTACAIWKAPGDVTIPLWEQLTLVPIFTRICGLSGIPRVMDLLARLERIHAEAVPEPHYSLNTLGVEPSCQGRGAGSELLAPMLARCDREGRRVYLETFKTRNVSFYERHGFRVVKDIGDDLLPAGFVMVRGPRAPHLQ